MNRNLLIYYCARFTKLVLFALLAFGISFSCKDNVIEVAPFEAKLYTSEQVIYPDNPITIQESVKDSYIVNYFLPWNISSENLQDSLVHFPGKEVSYLDIRSLQDTRNFPAI